MVCALFSHTHYVTYHVTSYCDFLSDTCDITLSYTPSYVVSSKKRKTKEI